MIGRFAELGEQHMKTILKTEPVEAFFQRGCHLARLADGEETLPAERIMRSKIRPIWPDS